MDAYDSRDPKSIEAYAKRLKGKTFYDVLNMGIYPEGKSKIDYEGKKLNKGKLGNLLEERYFGYEVNSISAADFPEAGVELKTTCYDITKSGRASAGERLVLGMLSFDEPIEDDFFKSHVWTKCKSMLLIEYERVKGSKDKLSQRIEYACLFTPSDADLRIIADDYRVISAKVKSGKAHELSESDTVYLSAATKGASEATMWVLQKQYAPKVPAKKRAFSFKRSYMDYILHEYIFPDADISSSSSDYGQKIIADSRDLEGKSFDELLIEKINGFAGMTDEELCLRFKKELKGSKSRWSELVFCMLGVSSNGAEELQKANMVVKSIKVEEAGGVKESVSFPAFEFADLLKEDWDDSALLDYLEETRFLFIIWRKVGSLCVLEGAKVWNMPYKDLEEVRKCWEKTREIVFDGVKITPQKVSKGVRYLNNLPGERDNAVAHVRPHASKRAYRFEDGSIVGNIENDASELPDGRMMTKQCFWLNSNYVYESIAFPFLDKKE